jgi:hypothetical protein
MPRRCRRGAEALGRGRAVSGNERADADVDVGIHGESVEYNPMSGKIRASTQSDLKSE